MVALSILCRENTETQPQQVDFEELLHQCSQFMSAPQSIAEKSRHTALICSPKPLLPSMSQVSSSEAIIKYISGSRFVLFKVSEAALESFIVHKAILNWSYYRANSVCPNHPYSGDAD